MQLAFWDHVTNATVTGVTAADTVLLECVMPEPRGLYAVRYWANVGLRGGTALKIDFGSVGIPQQNAVSLYRQCQLIAGDAAVILGLESHETELVVGPAGVGAVAHIILRTAMLVNETISVGIWARYLGGIRAAGPLRSPVFPT